MAIFSDLVQLGFDTFPKKPNAPAAPNVNPQAAEQRTAQGNLDTLPTLEEIARGVDTFNLSQRNKALTTAIPGYTNLVAGAGGTLGSWLRGEIPQDVAAQVNRSSAAQALAGGYGGSGMQDTLTARDLGLTSLDLQKAGVSALPSYLGTVGSLAIPKPFDVTSGFLTPGQDIAAEQFNELNRYSQTWLQNQLDALPDPAMAAIAKDVGGIADIAGTALLAWAGGGIGGMIGGAGGASAGAQLGARAGGAGSNESGLFGNLFGSGGGGGGGGMDFSF